MYKTFNRFYKVIASILLIIVQLQFCGFQVNADTPIPVSIQSALNVSIKSSSAASTIIALRWAENRVSKRCYYIQRKTDNGDYNQVYSGIYMPYISYPAPTSTIPVYYNIVQDVITGDSSAHTYTYRVIAVDNSGNFSVYTDEVSFSPTDAAEPLSLDVKTVSDKQIDLAWTYPGTSSYNTVIERRRRDGNDTNWYEVATVPKDKVTYSDTNLPQNTRYYYRIRAVASPNIDSYRFPGDILDPYSTYGTYGFTLISSPTDLSGYITASNSVKLSWTNNAQGKGTYIERRKQNQQSFTVVGTAGSDAFTYFDSKDIELNTTYVYRIRAFDLNYDTASDYSNEITVISSYISEPTNLTATTNNAGDVELKWKDNSSNETSFEIWRKAGISGSWELYGTVGSKVTAFVDKKAVGETLYFYKVRAYSISSDNYSIYSNQAQTWSTLLNPPTELKVATSSAGNITLTWRDNSNNESGFVVERKIGLESIWTEYRTLPANSVTFSDSGLLVNKQYFYRIKVYDNTFYNSYNYSEDTLFSTETPSIPTGLSVKAASAGGVEVKWASAACYKTGYILEKKQGKSGVFSRVAELDADKTSYLDSSINYNAKYYYRIKAVNNYFYSDYSSEVLALTGTKPTFSDVKNNFWGWEAIEDLSGLGVFNIPEGGKFYPEAKVTRGEFTSYLVKAFKLKATAVGSFYDVKANNKYYKEIMIAVKMGITTPSKNNYYYPNYFITREEMAVMLVKTMKVIDEPIPAQDIDILKAYEDYELVSTWAQDSIAAAIGQKIVVGIAAHGTELLAPKDLGSRAEAALMIYKALNS